MVPMVFIYLQQRQCSLDKVVLNSLGKGINGLTYKKKTFWSNQVIWYKAMIFPPVSENHVNYDVGSIMK